jgi:RNA polymerase sigma factor (sigma-70 family)
LQRSSPPGATSADVVVRATDLEVLQTRLAGAVARICPFWLAREREDLVQAALLRIVGATRPHPSAREFTATYLWKTAHSVVLDEIRRARWRFERPLEREAMEASDPAPAADPERCAAARQRFDAVRACLRGLEPSRRRAVLLHLTGFGHAEAASILGKTVRQTDNLMHRGMKDLRACLRSKKI